MSLYVLSEVVSVLELWQVCALLFVESFLKKKKKNHNTKTIFYVCPIFILA